MSTFRVCKIKKGAGNMIGFREFDDKQDAEHYAKNESIADSAHGFEVQKNNHGEFMTIKAYLNGEVV
jgi:hypothetical protein